MYARVVRWEGGEPDAMRQAVGNIKQRAGDGPPDGVRARAFRLLADPDAGRAIAIVFCDTEEDMRAGHEALDAMSPPGDMGRRASVEMYEVAVDLSA